MLIICKYLFQTILALHVVVRSRDSNEQKLLLLKVSKKNKVTVLLLWLYVVRFFRLHDELGAWMLVKLLMEVDIRVTSCLCSLLTGLLTGGKVLMEILARERSHHI